MESYIVCRLAPWSEKYALGARGRFTIKALRDALKNPDLINKIEFQHALTGRILNVTEARNAGARALNVRYDADRQVAVINL